MNHCYNGHTSETFMATLYTILPFYNCKCDNFTSIKKYPVQDQNRTINKIIVNYNRSLMKRIKYSV